MIEFNGILYGFTNLTTRKIMAFQFGNSKESLAITNFSAGEMVKKFVIYKNKLYAVVSGSSTGRVWRLDKVNTGAADNWTEIHTVSDITQKIRDAVVYGGYIYLIGNSNMLYTDGATLTTSTSMASNFTPYAALAKNDNIFIYGTHTTYGQSLYSYNGTAFVKEYSHTETIDYDTYIYIDGKPVIVEYKGKIYFPIREGSYLVLMSYDINDDDTVAVMSLHNSDTMFTALLVYNGVIFCAEYNKSDDDSNVVVYVIERYVMEKVLVPGDGDISDSLKRVDSDVLDSKSGMSIEPVPPFNSYPVMVGLKGKMNTVIKYAPRLEGYSEISDAEELVGVNLKDLADQLAHLSISNYYANGENTVVIRNRDMVGKNDLFMTFSEDTDYGNEYIKEFTEQGRSDVHFNKVTINWNNMRWSDSVPVSVGSLLAIEEEFSFESVFINDPITAANIAVEMLRQLVSVDKVSTVLSFAYFIELYDNIAYNIDREFVYYDKDKEYKVVALEHNMEEKTTSITVLERVVSLKVEAL